MTNIISNDYFKCPTPLSEYEVMVDDFKDMLQDLEKKVSFFTIEIPHKSIFNVEMFWVFCHIRKFKPKLFFESGVYKGRSTAIIAETLLRYLPDSNLLAVGSKKETEMDELNKLYSNAEVVVRDGFHAAKQLRGRRELLGVLIDGPKIPMITVRKYGIYRNLFSCPNIKFLFQHDVSPFSAEKNRFRFEAHYTQTLKAQGNYCYIIDDDFEDKFGFLDTGDKSELVRRNLGVYVTEKWE